MTEIKLKTRKEYLQERFDKANIYLVGYLIGLESLFEDETTSLDELDELIIEIEQLPITLDIRKDKYRKEESKSMFNWNRWFDYDNLSQENGE